jgi:hypothetical protein
MVRRRLPFVTHAIAPDGAEIVYIALANHTEPATILREDFDEFQARGLSLLWTLNSNGHGNSYVKMGASMTKGNLVQVGRIIARARGKTMVRYLDGNRLNMKRGNLALRACRGAKQDLPERLQLSGYCDEAEGATAVSPQTTMPAPTRRRLAVVPLEWQRLPRLTMKIRP